VGAAGRSKIARWCRRYKSPRFHPVRVVYAQASNYGRRIPTYIPSHVLVTFSGLFSVSQLGRTKSGIIKE